MPNAADLDDAFAQHLNGLGMASMEDIEEARTAQALADDRGERLSLADALIQTGVITVAIKKNILKQLETQKRGIKQLGQYKLIKKLGEGGMGAVYLAEDTGLQRQVALKILPKKLAADPQFLERFRREAKAAGKLLHPNICGAYAFADEQGVHYYVMEYCEGESLGAKIDRENWVGCDEAVEIMKQAARGLQYAHELGFIHRDIKPDNIMLTKSGEVKILDLGLSKNLDTDQNAFLTQTDMMVGTPHYISPEQANCEQAPDGRTDIYSLGATFYHLVTGVTPFDARTAASVVMKHLTEQLPNPQETNPDVPDHVVHVISRMMAKDPADRYDDCNQLIEDLEQIVVGRPPSSHALDASRSSIAGKGLRSELRRVDGRRLSGPGRRGSGMRSQERRRRASGPASIPGRRLGRGTSGLGEGVGVRDLSDGRVRGGKTGNPMLMGGAIAGALIVLIGVLWLMSGGENAPGRTGKKKQRKKHETEVAEGTENKAESGSSVNVGNGDQEGKRGQKDPGDRKEDDKRPGGRATTMPGPSAAPPIGGGWISLFNGRDLSGWERVDRAPSIEAGEMVLRTDAEIQRSIPAEHYELTGVLRCRSGGPDPDQELAAFQLKRRGRGRGDGGVVAIIHGDGDVHLKERGRRQMAKSGSRTVKMNAWQPFRLFLAGGRFEFFLSGRSIARARVDSSSGRLLAIYINHPDRELRLKGLRYRKLDAQGRPEGASESTPLATRSRFDPIKHQRWVPGLAGTYFKDVNFSRKVLTRVDPVLKFNWLAAAPMPGMPVNNFSIRWQGKLRVHQAGTYRFYALVDDKIHRFMLAGKSVLSGRFDDDVPSKPFNLGAGDHDVQIEVVEDRGNAAFVLYWECSRFKKQVVPASAFVHDADLTGTLTPLDTSPSPTADVAGADRLKPYLDAFDAAVKKRDPAAAKGAAAKAARDPRLKGMVAELKGLEGAATALERDRSRRKKALKALLDGKPRSFQTKKRTIKGIVRTVEKGTIKISVKGKLNKKTIEYGVNVKFGELTPGCRSQLGLKFPPDSPDAYIVQAVRRIGMGMLDAAAKSLKAAGKHPLVPYYQKRLDVARWGVVEAGARHFWDERIKPFLGVKELDKARAKEAQKAVNVFRKEYGKTKFAASMAKALQSLDVALARFSLDVTAGLIGYWKFDEGEGTTTADALGRGYTGQLLNGLAWTEGKTGKALQFDGRDDLVKFPGKDFSGHQCVTTAFWVKIENCGHPQSLMSWANSRHDNEYLMYFSGSRLHLFLVCRGTPRTPTWQNAGIYDGAWHHMAFYCDGAKGMAGLYIDGVDQGEQPIPRPVPQLEVDPNGMLFGQDQDGVGRGFSSSQAFKGVLDELRIYNRILSAVEIKALAKP